MRGLWATALLLLACSNDPTHGPGSSTPGDSGPDGASPRIALACGTDSFAYSRADVGEVQLNVACQGQGRTAILLHGYPEFHLAWRAVASELSKAGYRVVAPDQRGFNDSDRPEQTDAYYIDHLVNDISHLIEAVATEPVLLVAHDWGGVVAWVLAHRRPELLRALVVANGPHPDVWMRPEVDAVGAKASAVYVPLIADGTIGPNIVEAQLSPFLSPAELDRYRQSWALPGAARAMANWYSANVYPDDKLPTGVSIALPTVLLWGMADPFVTPSEIDHIRDFVPDLRVRELPGVGHWVPHEKPDEVAAAVRDLDAELH